MPGISAKGKYISYSLHGVQTQQEQEYATTFVISGMVAMLEQWLRETGETPMDTEHLAKLICRITGSDL